jgi:hypothetical protein
MGRKDREYRRRQRAARPPPAPGLPVAPAPDPAEAPAGESGTVTVPEDRVKGWLDALQSAKADQAELRKLRGELEASRARIRHLEGRLAELDRNLRRER